MTTTTTNNDELKTYEVTLEERRYVTCCIRAKSEEDAHERIWDDPLYENEHWVDCYSDEVGVDSVRFVSDDEYKPYQPPEPPSPKLETPKDKAQEALRLLKEAVLDTVKSGVGDRNSAIATHLGIRTDRNMLTWEVLKMLVSEDKLTKESAKYAYIHSDSD